MPHANRTTEGCPNHLLGAPRPAFVKPRVFDQDGQVVANAVVATVRAGGTAGDVVFSNLPHGTDVRQDPKVRLAYPNYFSLDMRVSKDVQVNLQHAVRLSFTVRNLTNHFNPLECIPTSPIRSTEGSSATMIENSYLTSTSCSKPRAMSNYGDRRVAWWSPILFHRSHFVWEPGSVRFRCPKLPTVADRSSAITF